MNNLAVLVNSCDAYENVWDAFFKMFFRFWEKCNCPVYLNTETKDFSFRDRSINCLHFQGNKGAWSKRLLNALQSIEEDFILMFLDDFILEEPVNDDRLKKMINILVQLFMMPCLNLTF